MIKLFVHLIEDEIDYLKDFYIASWHTHYIMDEYGKIIYIGDLQSVEKRLIWMENLSVPKYELVNK